MIKRAGIPNRMKINGTETRGRQPRNLLGQNRGTEKWTLKPKIHLCQRQRTVALDSIHFSILFPSTMAHLVEHETIWHQPTPASKPQPYNPYPTLDAEVIFFILRQAQERIVDFNAPFPPHLSFPMGTTPNLPLPKEPVHGTCQLTHLRCELKFESRVDHFRISNPNFFRGRDFHIAVYTSTTNPNTLPFSVIRQHGTERYGWSGKVDFVYGRIGVVWTKHVVDRSIPETLPPSPPLTPKLRKQHRQNAGRNFACAGCYEWLTVFRRSCQIAAEEQRDFEEASISSSPVLFRQPSISSDSYSSDSTEDG